MPELTMDCDDCGVETEAEDMGIIPVVMVSDEEALNDFWVRGAFCTECGTIQPMNISDEEREEAEEKYFDLLVENDLMAESELESLKG